MNLIKGSLNLAQLKLSRVFSTHNCEKTCSFDLVSCLIKTASNYFEQNQWSNRIGHAKKHLSNAAQWPKDMLLGWKQI